MNRWLMWRVAAQGRFLRKMGRRSFTFSEAVTYAADCRAHGYADAHAQLDEPGLPPFALTLVVRGKPKARR